MKTHYGTYKIRFVVLQRTKTGAFRFGRKHQAARNQYQAQRARHDMRTWKVERRKRTRHLIELGGLVFKAGIVELTNDHCLIILGALI